MSNYMKLLSEKAAEVLSRGAKFLCGKLKNLKANVQQLLRKSPEVQEKYEIYDEKRRRLAICEEIEKGVISKNENDFEAPMSIFRWDMRIDDQLVWLNLMSPPKPKAHVFQTVVPEWVTTPQHFESFC